jgi:capsular polysaccharide biosynthesis protein
MSQQKNELIQQDIIPPESNDDEIDLLGLIQTLGEEKWLLFGVPFICVCITAVISMFITPIFTSKATFIVPEKQTSAPAVIEIHLVLALKVVAICS